MAKRDALVAAGGTVALLGGTAMVAAWQGTSLPYREFVGYGGFLAVIFGLLMITFAFFLREKERIPVADQKNPPPINSVREINAGRDVHITQQNVPSSGPSIKSQLVQALDRIDPSIMYKIRQGEFGPLIVRMEPASVAHLKMLIAQDSQTPKLLTILQEGNPVHGVTLDNGSLGVRNSTEWQMKVAIAADRALIL